MRFRTISSNLIAASLLSSPLTMMLHKDEEKFDYDDIETTPSEMKGLAFTFIFLMTIVLAMATGLILLVF